MAAERSRSEPSWAEAACQLAGVVVPLAFHTLGTLGFEATKVLLVRLLALVLVVGWLGRESARIGTEPGPFAWRSAVRGIRAGPIWPVVLGVGGVLTASAVATVFSVRPLVSLLGSWDRGQGLVTTLAWVVLGIAAALAGRDPVRRRGLAAVWCLGSVPVLLYALVQQARLDPVAWLNQTLGVASTLGSATHLATHLAMLLPLTLASAARAALAAQTVPVGRPRSRHAPTGLADPRWQLAGWTALLVLQAAALVLTQVRGGLLALGAGLLVTLAFVLWPARPRLVVAGGGLALAALLVATGVLAAAPRADVGNGEDTSAVQRLLIWQDALQAIAGPRALVGYGPETQMVGLEPHYPLSLALRFENARFDRAHNLLLDTVLTTGLLGLAALLGFLAGVVRVVLGAREYRAGAERWLGGGLLGVLAANVVANQVAFDSAATGLLFWMAAGLAVSPAVPAAVPAPAPRRTSRRRRSAGSPSGPAERLAPAVRLRATALLAALAIGLATLPWLTGHFLSDLYHTRALAFRAGEAPGSSSRQELAAVHAAPWLDVPVLALGDVFVDLARTTAEAGPSTITTFADLEQTVPTTRAAQLDAARLAYERAVALNPRDPYTHAALARLWVTRGEAATDPDERTAAYGRAVEAYDRAIAAGPSRVAFYDEAGVALTRWGRPRLALERFQQAEALTRPTAERLARMGDAQVALGDPAAARALYERALTLDDRSAPAEAGLAALDRAAGDLTSALEHAQRAARFQMRNWVYQRDLAVILMELGQDAEALAAARAARRMAPAWEEPSLTALIQSLGR